MTFCDVIGSVDVLKRIYSLQLNDSRPAKRSHWRPVSFRFMFCPVHRLDFCQISLIFCRYQQKETEESKKKLKITPCLFFSDNASHMSWKFVDMLLSLIISANKQPAKIANAHATYQQLCILVGNAGVSESQA